MRCKRCWKKLWEDTIHTCVPYQHYEGITWTAIIEDWDKVPFIVDDVILDKDMLVLKITSWKHKGEYSYVFFHNIKDNLEFNLK